MNKLAIIVSAFLMTILSSCKKTNEVIIETPMGVMRARLYDDTPQHRDNFLKLVENGAYDSLLFHRVIEDNIIQGGDPESRTAGLNEPLGGHSIGEPIDAEILFPKHYHKRGAIVAARQSDKVNPERKSSGSQFYIVVGPRHRTEEQMDNQELEHDNRNRSRIYTEILHFYEDSLQMLQNEGRSDELSAMQFRILDRVEEILNDRGHFKYPDEVRADYINKGGLIELDGEYTVFGEIIDGFDVLDSIANVHVGLPRMRPLENVWMVIKPAN